MLAAARLEVAASHSADCGGSGGKKGLWRRAPRATAPAMAAVSALLAKQSSSREHRGEAWVAPKGMDAPRAHGFFDKAPVPFFSHHPASSAKLQLVLAGARAGFATVPHTATRCVVTLSTCCLGTKGLRPALPSQPLWAWWALPGQEQNRREHVTAGLTRALPVRLSVSCHPTGANYTEHTILVSTCVRTLNLERVGLHACRGSTSMGRIIGS
ncbi:hypothetical protein TREES_T100010141 [Tupaia chinensis]|uniref:Uncharacterized protein n=1 Tax=Tupaia chinensis TaxID=246437 RepID=L9JG13_TUPCH|nr:hypothetical protein TREES_T100010141 [Tupaia chinensis]